jgi:hypothetical protein
VDDLATRLLAAIDAKDATARAAAAGTVPDWMGDGTDVISGDGHDYLSVAYSLGGPATAIHIAENDPACVIRRCAADRKIVELHGGGGHECSVFDHTGNPDFCHYVLEGDNCSTMLLLAEGYGIEEADHG